jgi:hypothetical protein
MILTRENRSTGRKSVPVPLCPPQSPNWTAVDTANILQRTSTQRVFDTLLIKERKVELFHSYVEMERTASFKGSVNF